MFTWMRILLLGLTVLFGSGAAGESAVVECDIGEDLGMASDDVFAPSKTIATLGTIPNKEDCYRECCNNNACNAVSFGEVNDAYQCILLNCDPFDTCTWRADENWASGTVNRTIEDESTTSSSTSTPPTSTPPSSSSSDSGVGDANANANASANGDVNAQADSSSSPTSSPSSTPLSTSPSSSFNSSSLTQTTSSDDKLLKEWEDIWNDVNDEENEVDGGDRGWASTSSPSSSYGTDDDFNSDYFDDDVDDNAGFHDFHDDGGFGDDLDSGKPQETISSEDAKHKFDSAYLGSFSDNAIDSPALVIGISATVLLGVIVLVCVAMKLTNRQRNKYKRLSDEESFNSNSVNAPLTGGGTNYESYD